MSQPLLDLRGRTAVVTGSSSGIGRAIALALAAAGAQVVVHARTSQAAAEEVAAGVRAAGGKALVLLGDLADQNKLTWLVNDAWNWQQKIDIWINNAGADILTGAAARLSFDEKLQLLWTVDVRATIVLTREVGARMVNRGSGSIVNIGWDHSQLGMPGDSGQLFAATKGAVAAFTRSAAQTLAPQVRVNCVAPGWIKTAWGERASAHWQARAQRDSLAERWGTPEDVAAAVCYLASPAAAFISGQTLAVNGGLRTSS